jgi:hypothetical protein
MSSETLLTPGIGAFGIRVGVQLPYPAAISKINARKITY